VVAAVLLAAAIGTDRKGSSSWVQSSSSAGDARAGKPSEAPRVYAVAALNANLRALPSTRGRVIGVFKRGAKVVEIERQDGFIKFRRDDAVEAWISSDLLIDMADLDRLQWVSSADYMVARERLKPMERLTEHVERLMPQVRLLLAQVEAQDKEMATTIGEIESFQRPPIDVDESGGIWFSLAARAAAGAGEHAEALPLATAAIFADPLKTDYHTALGFSAIATNERALIGFMAVTLPVLAPGSTNTWVVVGIHAALTGKSELAHGALLAAIERSRNRATTIKVLRGMASRAEGNAVVDAVARALISAKEAGL